MRAPRRRSGLYALLPVFLGLLYFAALRDGPHAQATPPALATDKTGYLAGETVSVAGTGFTAGEVVTLLVAHASGAAEAGAGHDPMTVTADAEGRLAATWPVGDDLAGHEFTLSATRAEGAAVAPVTFMRIAVVSTDKYDYEPGETAAISGAGFRSGEAVTVHVVHSTGANDGAGHEPFDTAADTSGRISVGWFVNPDDSKGSIFRLTATGTESGLVATSTFTDLIITQIDDEGPDDEPGQKDLNQMSSELGPSAVAVTWNWDDTDFGNLGGNTGDACALVDTNQDGFANYAFCVVADGNPAVKISNRLYTCNNTRSDRCAGPTEVTVFTSTSTASVVPNSDPFRLAPFNALHNDGNDCDADANCLTSDTVANVTLQLSDVGGAAVAKLLNVCSYPSQEPNSDPSDCVVTPDSGFLTIVKNADPDGTPFTFTSSAASQAGQSSWTITPSAGTGSVVQIPFEATTTLDLTEAIPANWKLTSVSCAIQTAPATTTGTAAATPVLGAASAGVTDLEIRAGLETICTFTDAKQQGYIKVRKETVGGLASKSYDFQFTPSGFGGNAAFTLTTTGSGGSAETASFGPVAVDGSYSVSETNLPAGWNLTSSSCTNGTPAAITVVDGQTTICTFTNTEDQNLTRGKIKIVKITDPVSDTTTEFTFTRDYEQSPFTLKGGEDSISGLLAPGTYTVAESGPPAGWTLSSLDCVVTRTTSDGQPTTSVANVTSPGVSIALEGGDTVTCTYTNLKKPTLTLVKTVVNDNGGTKTASDFQAMVDGNPVSWSTAVQLDPGPHTASETTIPVYTASAWGGDCATNGTITLAAGDAKTCTITNDDIAPSLKLVKQVVNDNGGTAQATDFTLTASGPTPLSGQGGALSGATFQAGAYTLSETGPSGYAASSWNCTGNGLQNGSTITLGLAESAECTIVNDDIPPSLTLVKVVTNDNGGNAVAADFTLTAAGPTPISGAGGAASDALFHAGAYALSEIGPSGYTASGWVCEGTGTQNNGSVTLELGQTATCRITNDDKPAKVTLIKDVVNDNGGNAGVNDFGLTIGGTPVQSGQTLEVNANTPTVLNEAGLTGYSFVSITGAGCPAALGGSVTLDEGQEVTCTIRNDDQPARVRLIKYVVNNNGGSAGSNDFGLTIGGAAVTSGQILEVNSNTAVALNEAGLAGYSFVSMTGTGCPSSLGGTVTLGEGELITCTITNDDNAPSLTLVKQVDNTYCGSGCAAPADFILTAAGYNPASPVAGTYNLAESGPAGYAQVSLTCSDTGAAQVTSVTLGLGESVTCTFVNRAIPGQIRVTKTVVPAADGGLFNLTIGGAVIAANVGSGGDTGFIAVATGIAHAVGETAGTGTLLTDYVSKINCGGGDVAGASTSVTVTPGASVTCAITNTKKGMVTVHKLTNGVESTSMTWTFSLNGSGVNTTDSSPPTLVDFGAVKLVPTSIYTVCETGIAAGWTLEWKVDTNNDGVPDTIIPFFAGGNAPPAGWSGYSNVYDPNYVAFPGTYTNDTRCVQFTVQPDQTLAFEINNSFPGGEPRTIGYWKNWNTCTGGNQANTAASNGGPAAGWYILDNLLNNPGYHLGPANGAGLHLDGNPANVLTGSLYTPTDCIAAVRILDKSRITDGRKLASDGAYNLAAQLMAALLNLSAGAETCSQVNAAVNSAQSLLVTIGFNGTAQSYLKSNQPLYGTANSLAATLDTYNNGNLCGQ